MLLAREFIDYLSRQLVQRLTQTVIDASNSAATAELIDKTIADDLAVEDKLNDEVRDLLDQYSDYMKIPATRSPVFTRVTPSPTARTSPTPSESGTIGNFSLGLYRPPATSRSR